MTARLRLGRLPRPMRRRRMRPVVTRLSRAFTALDRWLVVRGRGSIGGWVAGGVPVLLLTTEGRRTGATRTTPLLYHRTGDDALLLVAVNGAADWDPDWLHNVVADPAVEVEIDGRRHTAAATLLAGEERAAVWEEVCRAFPGLANAQRACRRSIPVVRLRVE